MSSVIICGPETEELSRERDGEPRWCFSCRAAHPFDLVVISTVEPSYYDPIPSIRCTSCGTSDGDLFPGRVREWE